LCELKKTYAMVLKKLDQQELKISGSMGIKRFLNQWIFQNKFSLRQCLLQFQSPKKNIDSFFDLLKKFIYL